MWGGYFCFAAGNLFHPQTHAGYFFHKNAIIFWGTWACMKIFWPFGLCRIFFFQKHPPPSKVK